MNPKTYLTHSNPEALSLRDGTQTLIVVPFQHQPRLGHNGKAVIWRHPDDTRQHRIEVAPGCYSLCSGSVEAFQQSVLDYAPYAIGDEIQVRAAYNPRHHFRKRPVIARLLCRSVEAQQAHSMTVDDWLRAFPWLLREYDEAGGNLARIVAEWNRRYPGLPWAGNPWTWCVAVSLKGA
ncbi:MAG: hypothetical protein LLG01_00865 [Planctomycetaceae bacterium]|nr:hypothetical protein [Planctomycetaceae bacterium]